MKLCLMRRQRNMSTLVDNKVQLIKNKEINNYRTIGKFGFCKMLF